MSWAVVIFIDDNTVEVVPSTWNADNECFWPPLKGNKLKEAILKRSSQQSFWTKYKIRLLKCYDDFKLTSKKCALAREAESSSSCSEQPTATASFGKGCRKTTQKNLPEYEYMSNSENDEEEAIAGIKFPRNPFSMCKYDEQSRRLETAGIKQQDQNEEDQTNGALNTPPLCQTNKNNDDSITSKEVLPTNNNEDMFDIRRLLERIDFMVEKNKDFQKQCMRNFSLIGNRLREINENLEIIMDRPHNEMVENNETGDEFVKWMDLFPIEQEEKLKELEMHLKDLTVLSKFAKEFSRVGGDNIKEITRGILYRMLTNEVGALYSFEGFKKKQIFKNLEVCKLVFRAVRLNKNASEATEKEIILHIKTWLAQAKFRIKDKVATTK